MYYGYLKSILAFLAIKKWNEKWAYHNQSKRPNFFSMSFLKHRTNQIPHHFSKNSKAANVLKSRNSILYFLNLEGIISHLRIKNVEIGSVTEKQYLSLNPKFKMLKRNKCKHTCLVWQKYHKKAFLKSVQSTPIQFPKFP